MGVKFWPITLEVKFDTFLSFKSSEISSVKRWVIKMKLWSMWGMPEKNNLLFKKKTLGGLLLGQNKLFLENKVSLKFGFRQFGPVVAIFSETAK